jgi:hypothetical protein
MAWQPPSISVKWGRFFAPDPAEEKAIVDAVVAARAGEAPLIPLRAAVQKLAPVFGIENVDAALEKLEEETEQRKADAEDAALREQQQLHDLASGNNPSAKPNGAGSSRRGDAKASSGGGSGGPGAGSKPC